MQHDVQFVAWDCAQNFSEHFPKPVPEWRPQNRSLFGCKGYTEQQNAVVHRDATRNVGIGQDQDISKLVLGDISRILTVGTIKESVDGLSGRRVTGSDTKIRCQVQVNQQDASVNLCSINASAICLCQRTSFIAVDSAH
jgi:hypothetical protein